ncbi:MAG: hypothetical protein K1X35_09905 [Caulobacteraceae bacterium]|nr:hypothetical protein [Caulobacteraceae bacterium]
MSAPDWTTLAGMGLSLLVNLAGSLVAWGALRATVETLAERVGGLESDSDALARLQVQVARVETRLDALLEQFRDLNAAIRWMRADTPPVVEPGAIPAAAHRPRRGRA